MKNTNNELRELLNRALECLGKPKQPFKDGDVVENPTPEKWLEACINEAVKLYKKEDYFINIYGKKDNLGAAYFMRGDEFMNNGKEDNIVLMKDGIWSEVIKPDVTLEILFEGWYNAESYVNHIKDNLEQFDKAINNLQNQK